MKQVTRKEFYQSVNDHSNIDPMPSRASTIFVSNQDGTHTNKEVKRFSVTLWKTKQGRLFGKDISDTHGILECQYFLSGNMIK